MNNNLYFKLRSPKSWSLILRMKVLYRDLQSVQPPCGLAVSWGWQCDREQRSPCWPRWRWWPHGSAPQRPGWHCGSSVLVMESEGWLELWGGRQKISINKKNKSTMIPKFCVACVCDISVTCMKRSFYWRFLKELTVTGLGGVRDVWEQTDCSLFVWLCVF